MSQEVERIRPLTGGYDSYVRYGSRHESRLQTAHSGNASKDRKGNRKLHIRHSLAWTGRKEMNGARLQQIQDRVLALANALDTRRIAFARATAEFNRLNELDREEQHRLNRDRVRMAGTTKNPLQGI